MVVRRAKSIDDSRSDQIRRQRRYRDFGAGGFGDDVVNTQFRLTQYFAFGVCPFQPRLCRSSRRTLEQGNLRSIV